MSKLTYKLEGYKKEITTQETENIKLFKNYIQDFFNKFSTQNINKLMSITLEDLIENSLILANPSHVSHTMRIFNKYKEYLSSNYYEFTLPLVYYFNTNSLRIMHQNLKKNYQNKTFFHYLAIIAASSEISIDDILSLLVKLDDNPLIAQELSTIFSNLSYNKMEEAHSCYKILTDINKLFLINNISPEEAQNIFNLLVKDNNRLITDIIKYLNDLFEEFNNKLKELEKSLKEKLKFNAKIDELITKLNKTQEIKNIDEIMSLCPNDTIKNIVLDYIIDNNSIYYKELISKVTLLETNTDNNLTNLFQMYNYNYALLTMSEKHLLKDIPYSKIEEILKQAKILDLSDIESSIIHLSISKMKQTQEMIKIGNLTKEFINNNIYILRGDNDTLSFIIDNINYLSSHNINIKNYSSCLTILLSPNLINNLELLTKYNLTITKNTTNISFLEESNLNLKLDLIIELNMYPLSNLDILNYSLANIYNLNLATKLNIPFSKIKNNSNLIFNPYTSFIPEAISKKLACSPIKTIALPEILIPYQESPISLNINGIKVSINRVLLNLSKLDDLNNETIFYALIYNSYYNLEEIEILSKALLPSITNIYELVRK